MGKKLIGVIAVAVVIGIASHNNDDSSTKAKTVKHTPKVAHVEQKPKYDKTAVQQKIDEFTKKLDNILSTENTARGIVVKSMTNGDVMGTYENAKTASNNIDTMFENVMNFTVPSDIPSGVEDALKDAQNNVETVLSTDQDGFKNIMDFADSNKPSDISDAKDKFSTADSFIAEVKSAESKATSSNK
jgi:hypothetical protein